MSGPQQRPLRVHSAAVQRTADSPHEDLPFDWDPRSPAVQRDQIAAYDAMRERSPVARSRHGYTSVFRHADIRAVLDDPETFSSEVSRHPAIPNGMDPPRHTVYRHLVDRYFTPRCVSAFQPACKVIAAALIDALPEDSSVDFMQRVAWPFAVRAQCAFMGWPEALHQPLLAWTHKNHAATFAVDADAAGAVALEFDATVRSLLVARRQAGAAAPDDPTTRLLRDTVDGHPLTDDEIVSIARNWTVGELATIAAAAGILAHHLAADGALQESLRHAPGLLPRACDEILRLHGPLVFNRRRVTRAATLGGRPLAPGERLALLWPAANRDPRVFAQPGTCRLDRDPGDSLLYGAGIHVCPGAGLARMELAALLAALLARTRHVELDRARAPHPATYPGSGWAMLPLLLHAA